LYGSESEIEDSEAESVRDPVPRKKNVGDGARLRLDDEEPMDLLQGATGKITSTSFPPISNYCTLIFE
jgi:ribosomal RNA-processing protein 12